MLAAEVTSTEEKNSVGDEKIASFRVVGDVGSIEKEESSIARANRGNFVWWTTMCLWSLVLDENFSGHWWHTKALSFAFCSAIYCSISCSSKCFCCSISCFSQMRCCSISCCWLAISCSLQRRCCSIWYCWCVISSSSKHLTHSRCCCLRCLLLCWHCSY